MCSDVLFESERLIFKCWGNKDIDKAKKIWGNMEVTKFIGGPFDENKIKNRLRLEIENQQKHGLQYWPIYLKDNREFVGCCGLRGYKTENETKEIGFHLCKEYWGMGLATEAAKRVLEYAFDELQLKKVFAGHNHNNANSKKILMKLGFRYIGDEYYPPTGLNHPSYEIKVLEYLGTKH
jgi:RimJ/RimL family protein N-acetyltransferase